MTNPSDDPKGNKESEDRNGYEEPEIRTDGGEVAAQNPRSRTSGVQDGRTEPPQPGIPPFSDQPDQGETPANQPEDRHSKGAQVGDLPDSVESHFTPAELQRLQSIAASTNAKSAWVIKRLFRDPEE